MTALDLAAARIGDLALAGLADLPEGGGRGCVESAYRNAANLVFGSGQWICLLPAGTPLSPYAVTVAGTGAGEGASFLDASPGEKADVSRRTIALGNGRLSISLDAVEVFDSRLRRQASPEGGDVSWVGDAVWRGVEAVVGEPRDAVDRVRSHFLRSVIESRGKLVEVERGAGGLMADATRVRLGDLRSALGAPGKTAAGEGGSAGARPAAGTADRREVLAGGLLRLVGFGEGLTPSGDDFLVGLIAASRLVPGADGCAIGAAIAALSPAPAAATTRESRRMLEAALDGHYPEPILGLLGAAGEGDAGGVARWCGCLAGLGAASGQDMLAGVLFWFNGKVGNS